MAFSRLATCLLLALAALPTWAASSGDDAVRMAKSGVSEDVILAWAERQPSVSIDTAQIVALKDAKLSDSAVLSLLKLSQRPQANDVGPVRVTSLPIITSDATPLASFVRHADTNLDETAAPATEAVAEAADGVQQASVGFSVGVGYASPVYYGGSYYGGCGGGYYPSYVGGGYYPSYSYGYYPGSYYGGYYPRSYGYGYGYPYYGSGFSFGFGHYGHYGHGHYGHRHYGRSYYGGGSYGRGYYPRYSGFGGGYRGGYRGRR